MRRTSNPYRSRQQRRAAILARGSAEPEQEQARVEGAGPPRRPPTPWDSVQGRAGRRLTWTDVEEGTTPLLQGMAAAIESTMVETPRPQVVRGRDGLAISDGTVTEYNSDGTTSVRTLEPMALRPWERTAAQQRAAELAMSRMSPEPVVDADGAVYQPLGVR
ncbi:hypothetical protein [Streptomyces erythrochromogenes]|uniref:hypothetical protein n=1 Tax=Streptomyces erythrochromogenes TaxID=285574 RepID=UPI0036F9A695